MSDRSAPTGGAPVARWLLVAALILLGIGLYFWYAPGSRPAAAPAGQESP